MKVTWRCACWARNESDTRKLTVSEVRDLRKGYAMCKHCGKREKVTEVRFSQ